MHNNEPRLCIHVFSYELFVQKFDIKIKAVAPYNHQSLQAEHGIKSIKYFN